MSSGLNPAGTRAKRPGSLATQLFLVTSKPQVEKVQMSSREVGL